MYQSTKMFELGSCAFRQWAVSLDDGCKSKTCGRVHGYLLKAQITFSTNELDKRNWVQDFGSLKPLKAIFNDQFDHTLCIDQGDNLLPLFQELHKQGGCELKIMDGVGIEKTAEWCYHAAQQFVDEQSNGRVWVSKVEVWEHELNSAIYIPPKGDPFKYFPTHE